MDISLIIFPGTNRDNDMENAIEKVSGKKPNRIWHKDTQLGSPDLIILPGGFSYGDYLRCGAMAAHSPIMQDVIKHAEKGTPLLGVCNGFQMLVETHILPGALLRNKTLKFICKQSYLKIQSNANLFTSQFKKNDIIRVPSAHGEGNYFASEDDIKLMEDNDQIVFKYCNDNGIIDQDANANGSVGNIAGITNKRKTILGMMPHPEDCVLEHQITKTQQHIQTGHALLKNAIESLSH